MLDRGYFSHYTPEGKNITHILKQNNVYYKNFGELIGRASPVKYGKPEVFIQAWLNSPDHKNALLKSYYTDIGIGIVDVDDCRIVTIIFISVYINFKSYN